MVFFRFDVYTVLGRIREKRFRPPSMACFFVVSGWMAIVTCRSSINWVNMATESANPVKLFGKWSLEEIHISDISLQVPFLSPGDENLRLFLTSYFLHIRTTSLSMASTPPSWPTLPADTRERDSERLRLEDISNFISVIFINFVCTSIIYSAPSSSVLLAP